MTIANGSSKTLDLIRQRFFTLKDFSAQGRAYFSDDFDFDEAAVNKNLQKGSASKRTPAGAGGQPGRSRSIHRRNRRSRAA